MLQCFNNMQTFEKTDKETNKDNINSIEKISNRLTSIEEQFQEQDNSLKQDLKSHSCTVNL